jgi:hypothetical protein
MRSTKSQIVPAIDFSSITFSHQIYLLILSWEHHTTINCQWDYYTTKQLQNDSAHNNPLVVHVSFFVFLQLKVYVQYDCLSSLK